MFNDDATDAVDAIVTCAREIERLEMDAFDYFCTNRKEIQAQLQEKQAELSALREVLELRLRAAKAMSCFSAEELKEILGAIEALSGKARLRLERSKSGTWCFNLVK